MQKQFTSVCKSNVNIVIKCCGIQSTSQKLYFEHIRALVAVRGQRGCRGLCEGRPGLSWPPQRCGAEPSSQAAGSEEGQKCWEGRRLRRKVWERGLQVPRSEEKHRKLLFFLSVAWLGNCKMWKNTSLRFPWVLGEGRINACEILGCHGNRNLREGYGEINCLASRAGLNT